MYFDDRPKTRKEDLYGRDKEIQELYKAIQYFHLIAITGTRRIGKTSLIFVALKDRPHVYVDIRAISTKSRRSLYGQIEHAVEIFLSKHQSFFDKVRGYFKKIAGIQVFGSGIRLKPSYQQQNIIRLFRKLEKYKAIIVFDEVQLLEEPLRSELAQL